MCDLHEAVLRFGLFHPKPRSATAPLAWGYKSAASTRLYYNKLRFHLLLLSPFTIFYVVLQVFAVFFIVKKI